MIKILGLILRPSFTTLSSGMCEKPPPGGGIVVTCPGDAINDGDGDGVCGNVDNCPDLTNEDQANLDGDAFGDACEGRLPGP